MERKDTGGGEAVSGQGMTTAAKENLFVAGVMVALYATTFYSYPLFHTLAEFCSIAIAWGVFMMAWPARRFSDNDYLLFLGIAYLSVGTLDLMHTLTYKGMGIFHSREANMATQLWIAARYLESLALVAAPSFLGRKLPVGLTGAVFLTATSLFLISIFGFNGFPDCYVEGKGLTLFKKVSEYVICIILSMAIARMYKAKSLMTGKLFRLMTLSISLTILAELSFTFYISVYGISNLIGHYFKIISFFMIYKGVIEYGLLSPYEILFKNLKSSEESLRLRNAELAREVENRTRREKDLRKINGALEDKKKDAEDRLDEINRKKNDMAVKISELSLKASDMAQQNSRLINTLQALRRENEILSDQLSRYIRVFEQTHEDIDQLVSRE